MNEKPLEGQGGLSATLEVQFVQRGDKLFVIFGTGVRAKVISVGVWEADAKPDVIKIVT